MNKKTIVRKISQLTDKPQEIVNTVFRLINTAFINLETVTIYNFGEFKIVKSKVNTVYDFEKKKSVPFKGKYLIKFTPCPTVRKIINKKFSQNNGGDKCVKS